MKNLFKTSSLLIALFAFAAITFVACDKESYFDQSEKEVTKSERLIIGAKKNGEFTFKNKEALKAELEARFKKTDPTVKLTEINIDEQKLANGKIVNVLLAKAPSQSSTYLLLLNNQNGTLVAAKGPVGVCQSFNCDEGECIPFISSTVINSDGEKIDIWDCKNCDFWESCHKKSPIPGEV